MDGGTLVEYKFDKIEAMRHIEAVNGKRLLSFSTGTAYYTGAPRVHWQLEGEREQWDNPELNGGGVKALFFPDSSRFDVVSMRVCVYAETFEFVVRETKVKENVK